MQYGEDKDHLVTPDMASVVSSDEGDDADIIDAERTDSDD